MSGPSSAQQEVRSTFRACCDCFNKQPETGGATPPAIGPRNRSWWYAQAGASGLWYYNYFMQQTLNAYFSNSPPDWCLKSVRTSYGYIMGCQGKDASGATPEESRTNAWQKVIDFTGNWFNQPPFIGCRGYSIKSGPIYSFQLYDARLSVRIVPDPSYNNIGYVFRVQLATWDLWPPPSFTISAYRSPIFSTDHEAWWKIGKTFLGSFSSLNYVYEDSKYFLYIFIPPQYVTPGQQLYISLEATSLLAGNPIPAPRTTDGTTENLKYIMKDGPSALTCYSIY